MGEAAAIPLREKSPVALEGTGEFSAVSSKGRVSDS